jgi:CDP-glycerol glycerophosphotransferase (TagB/SpsB family)
MQVSKYVGKKVSNELWGNLFNSDNGNDIDILFNSFLNSHLRIRYSNFPINKFNKKPNKKPWITDEIPATMQQKKKFIYLVGVALIWY